MSDILPPPPAPVLGPKLQALRKRRRLTLDELAVLSGVSRSMLSQIERSQANPTFATLWNLTRALGVDLADLTGTPSGGGQPAFEHLLAHFTPEIRTEDGRCTLRILSPPASAGKFEWYELTLDPGANLASEPHASGAIEHLTVLDGTVEVTSGEEQTTVGLGSTVRYAADVRHAIANPGQASARALLVVAAV